MTPEKKDPVVPTLGLEIALRASKTSLPVT